MDQPTAVPTRKVTAATLVVTEQIVE